MSFLQWIMTLPFAKTLAAKALRWVLATGGAALGVWLVKAGADPGKVSTDIGFLIGIGGPVLSGILSCLDGKNVAAKMVASTADAFDAGVRHAEVQGEDTQRTVDQARATAVRAALDAADKKSANDNVNDVLARMRAGAA